MEFSQFPKILQERCHINPGQNLLVGVSGGADSMCLMHILNYLGYPVIAAHLDHMIRTESGQDADFIREMCEAWHIPFILKRIDVREYCKIQSLNLEEGARNLRYEFLFDTAKEANSKNILIAHHADDQVETVLMHFIRGAGLSGLKGMRYRTFLDQYSVEIPLIRPLLDFTRPQIESYCSEHQVPFVVDHTNLDTTYFRNRLRYELIPELETYNPRFRDVIRRTTESLQADQELINEIVERKWDTLLLETTPQFIRLDLKGLRGCSGGLRWNILRRAIKILRPDLRDFDHSVLNRLDEFVTIPPEHKVTDLIGHLEARLDATSLMIVESDYIPPVIHFPQFSAGEIFLKFPLQMKLTNDWRLEGEILVSNEIDMSSIMHAPVNEAWLDYESINGSISLRNHLPGDRIQPLGSSGHHTKVSDLFINRGIPKDARQAFPILCDSTRIIWLPGIMISEMCKVTINTKKILHLRVNQM
jgi:tRNA(Ile)-lysidine synthase